MAFFDIVRSQIKRAPATNAISNLKEEVPETPETNSKRQEDDGSRYGPGPAPYRLWADLEYLFYWVKPSLLPGPLVADRACAFT